MKFVILFALVILFAFKGSDPVDTFAWLSGAWEMKKPKGGSMVESWTIRDENTIIGKGLSVKNQDSTLLEAIELTFRDENFWYTPTVPDQNRAAPVPFKLVKSRGFHFVFENPKHDFPQRIVYHMKPVQMRPSYEASVGDTLLVRAETMDGDGIDYTFFRQ